MRYTLALAALCLVSAACGGSSTGVSTSAANSSTGSTASTTATTGHPTSSTSGAVGTSGTATASSSSGTPGTSGASGTTSGGPQACSPNAVWIGSQCVVTSCDATTTLQVCLFQDAGVGLCEGTSCAFEPGYTQPNSQNCGQAGLNCPPGTACFAGLGCATSDAGPAVGCEDAGCASGLACDPTYDLCDLATCGSGDDGKICLSDAGPTVCCGGACTQLQNNPANCGYCGNACGAGGCSDSECGVDCTLAAENTYCRFPGGASGFCCGGACVAQSGSDPLNCGHCGGICAPASTCTNGSCSNDCYGYGACDAGLTCVPGSTCAVSTCSGAADGQYCAAVDVDGLPHAGACCGQSCVNTATDPTNCGACGRLCPAGQVCNVGNCQPATTCEQAPTGSLCTTASGAPGLCCGITCADLSTDDLNCTRCFDACPAGTHCGPDVGYFTTSCYSDAGVSQSCPSTPCQAGYDCDQYGACHPTTCSGLPDAVTCSLSGTATGECCAGVCVDVSGNDMATIDNANCTACGQACPSLTVCFQSECQDQGGTPQSCDATMFTCPGGTACVGGKCVPQSCTNRSPGQPCAGAGFTGECCNEQCVDTRYDAANCGVCGATCAHGLCVNETCLDTVTQGTPCSPACAAGEACVYGVCYPSTCSGTLVSGYCIAEDGQTGVCCDQGCDDLASDPANCGSCGAACDGGQCSAGVCG